ncbi:hypothetical protein HJG60_008452 [Phyllostomus discolor]|uniref:Uncharacterized protein n=1 Tax=Phyllostomus discolor TaxID=89673 RepID=A0A834DQF7_9CHIR|nr:hypothetical protein HJG60_008452 [Phyllostomus discolor]
MGRRQQFTSAGSPAPPSPAQPCPAQTVVSVRLQDVREQPCHLLTHHPGNSEVIGVLRLSPHLKGSASALSVLLPPSPLPLRVPGWAHMLLAWDYRTVTPHSQALTCPREQGLRRIRMMLSLQSREGGWFYRKQELQEREGLVLPSKGRWTDRALTPRVPGPRISWSKEFLFAWTASGNSYIKSGMTLSAFTEHLPRLSFYHDGGQMDTCP